MTDATYEIAKFVMSSEVMLLTGTTRAEAMLAVEQVVTMSSWYGGSITADSMTMIVEEAMGLVHR